MLVITRKIGESIQIGEGVTLEVLEVRGSRVRIGIAAPSDVRIQRTEIVAPAEACVAPGLRPMQGSQSRLRQLVVSGS